MSLEGLLLPPLRAVCFVTCCRRCEATRHRQRLYRLWHYATSLRAPAAIVYSYQRYSGGRRLCEVMLASVQKVLPQGRWSAADSSRRYIRRSSVTGVASIPRVFREEFSSYDPLGALDAMAAQRTAEARVAALRINELLPTSPEVAKTSGLSERDVCDATDSYKTARGQQPGGATRMLFSHAQKTLAWDAFALAETLLTQPIMLVVRIALRLPRDRTWRLHLDDAAPLCRSTSS